MSNKTRELQLIQLEILKDISRFCEAKNITYYLIAGTLIGAIRHRGFIPWDDDVDIAMYRKDYEKFIDAFSKQKNDKYFVQNNYTDKGYSRFITKVRLNGTKQVERNLSNVKMHHGIYIDIFPLDNVSKNSGVCLATRGFIIRTLFAVANLRAGKRDYASKIKDLLKRTLRVFTLIIPHRMIAKIFDFVCTMSNDKNCEYTTSFASGYGWKKQLVRNEIYSKGTKVKFEGYEFNVPAQYKVLLYQLYGDFMKLPPPEKQTSVHTLDIIDFGPYGSHFEQKVEKE